MGRGETMRVLGGGEGTEKLKKHRVYKIRGEGISPLSAGAASLLSLPCCVKIWTLDDSHAFLLVGRGTIHSSGCLADGHLSHAEPFTLFLNTVGRGTKFSAPLENPPPVPRREKSRLSFCPT
jgi:hypothetical protein